MCRGRAASMYASTDVRGHLGALTPAQKRGAAFKYQPRDREARATPGDILPLHPALRTEVLSELQQCRENGECRGDDRTRPRATRETEEGERQQGKRGKVSETPMRVGPTRDGFGQPFDQLENAGLAERKIQRGGDSADRENRREDLHLPETVGTRIFATTAHARV